MSRSRQRRWFIKKTVLKNFTKFIGNHLWWSLFLTKLFQRRCFPQAQNVKEAVKDRQKIWKAYRNICYDSYMQLALCFMVSSQCVNRFLPIREAYLEPSWKSTIEVFSTGFKIRLCITSLLNDIDYQTNQSTETFFCESQW